MSHESRKSSPSYVTVRTMGQEPKKRSGGLRVPVVDPEGLVELLREAMAGHAPGQMVPGKEGEPQHQVTKRLGIARQHYYRLLAGHIGATISSDLARALDRALPRRRRPALAQVLTLPWGTRLPPRYHAWLLRSLRPYLGKEMTFHRRNRAGRIARLYGKLKQEPEAARHLSRLDGLRLFQPARQRLVMLRVVEPLLAGQETGAHERTLDDLRATGDLGRYLRAAVTAEMLLLQRPNDWEMHVQPGP